MLTKIGDMARDFLSLSKDKSIQIITDQNHDGAAAAAILIKSFKRLDKQFNVSFIEKLTTKDIEKEMNNAKCLLFFTCSIDPFLETLHKTTEPLFVLDNKPLRKEKLTINIKIINPHLSKNPGENECSRSELVYLFAKELSEKNEDLSKIAIIGLVGHRKEEMFQEINKQVLNDAQDLKIKKGIRIYPSTRPLRRALEYSTSPFIPGVTGNSPGTQELLKEIGLDDKKTLLDLNEEEMSKLITAVVLRQAKWGKQENILGNIYTVKFFNALEDVREIIAILEACSKQDHPDIAITYCLEYEQSKQKALESYTKYNQEIITGLKEAEKAETIDGKGFVILNAKDKVKNSIISTICSLLTFSPIYEEGTILIAMAYNKDKITVSAKIAGKGTRNLKQVLENSARALHESHPDMIIQVTGNSIEASCSIERANETKFIEALKKNLEIESIKI